MPRQSISLTEPNADWIKTQIDSKEYTSTSDALNDLIRQARRKEEEKMEALRQLLIEGEQSIRTKGYSQKSLEDIWAEAYDKADKPA